MAGKKATHPYFLMPDKRFMNNNPTGLFMSLGFVFIISLFLAIAWGSVSIPITDIIANQLGNEDNKYRLIIEQIRVPRALLAALVGALLGICGAITQGLFRNPLADPSLIGVTAGATVGASIVIILGASWSNLTTSSLGLSLVSLGAIIGAALSVTLVYRIATRGTGTSVATMLLAGIAITALAGGITNLLEFIADNESLRRFSLWRMGGLDGANYKQVTVLATIVVIIAVLLPKYSTALNALLLGESEARHLGVSVQKVKVHLIILVAMAVGTCVAMTGSIAFIGLVVPHIMRLLIGPDHTILLPASAIGGAILLVLADTFARSIIAPIELPAGVVTALLGAPFFISLLRQRHQYGMQQ